MKICLCDICKEEIVGRIYRVECKRTNAGGIASITHKTRHPEVEIKYASFPFTIEATCEACMMTILETLTSLHREREMQ